MNPALQLHKELLQKWRKAMDLVGPGPLEPHFEDSIKAVCDLDAKGTWVDLGSGAGFPGIALAALNPNATVLLVESRQKRAVFLSQVIAATKLSNISLFHGRTEHVSQTFDGIISRAYKPPPIYLQDASLLSNPKALSVLLLSGQQVVDIPASWKYKSEKQYTAGTSSRRRLVLSFEPKDTV